MFLGLDLPPPEGKLSEGRVYGMVAYSIFTWIYRIFLYTAIALFVYSYFTKALGALLFVLEIAIFLVWPIVWELGEWNKLRGNFRLNKRVISTLVVLGLFLTWFVIPFPHTESFVAVTEPQKEQTFYVPYNGVVKNVFVDRGDYVTEGQEIIQIASEELKNEILLLILEKDIIEQQIRVITFNQGEKEDDQGYIPEKEAELSGTVERLKGLVALNKNLTLYAKFSGEVFNWDKDLQVNQPVAKDQILGKIADFSEMYVMTFIPEESLSYVEVGQKVSFLLASNYKSYKGEVVKVIPTRTKVLNYPQIASVNGGDLPVTPDGDGNLQMVDTYYTAVVKLEDPKTRKMAYGERGYVEFTGPRSSMFMKCLRYLTNLFWKESSV